MIKLKNVSLLSRKRFISKFCSIKLKQKINTKKLQNYEASLVQYKLIENYQKFQNQYKNQKTFQQAVEEVYGVKQLREINKRGIDMKKRINQLISFKSQRDFNNISPLTSLLIYNPTSSLAQGKNKIIQDPFAITHPLHDLATLKSNPFDQLVTSSSIFDNQSFNEESQKSETQLIGDAELLQKQTRLQKYHAQQLGRGNQSTINLHLNYQYLNFNNQKIIPVFDYTQQNQDAIPQLSHHLDVVLNNKRKIFPVQSILKLSPSSRQVFYRLPECDQILDNQVGGYRKPSKDSRLIKLAQKSNMKYLFSTSTITPLLSHIHYCISNFRTPHFDNLSSEFDKQPMKFMVSQRKPNTVYLKRLKKKTNPNGKEEVFYAIDGDAVYSQPVNLILLKLGKYLERMLTTHPSQIQSKYPSSMPNPQLKNQNIFAKNYQPQQRNPCGYQFLSPLHQDVYRYSKFNSMLIRSQIDCKGMDDEQGPIVFQVKTRATAPLRYDIMNYLNYQDYKLFFANGIFQSYQREFYDLIRGAFLKYCLQMRMGRMQGAFIAYHNTSSIDGFQYFPIQDLERRLFGCTQYADTSYRAIFSLLQKILQFVVHDLQENSKQIFGSEFGEQEEDLVRIGFYANEYQSLLNVYVQMMSKQAVGKAKNGEALLANVDQTPFDVYMRYGVKTKVQKYLVKVQPVLNGIIYQRQPILFEPGDQMEIKYKIERHGEVQFDEYMKFLNEAFKSLASNISTMYQGTWKFTY